MLLATSNVLFLFSLLMESAPLVPLSLPMSCEMFGNILWVSRSLTYISITFDYTQLDYI